LKLKLARTDEDWRVTSRDIPQQHAPRATRGGVTSHLDALIHTALGGNKLQTKHIQCTKTHGFITVGNNLYTYAK
jgi:hypothetical protein